MKYELETTSVFEKWIQALNDRQALKAIVNRLERAKVGHLGDVKSVDTRVKEMRVFTGKGYRLYFTIKQGVIIVLLCGGDKSTQQRDIKKACQLARGLDYDRH